jgi:transcriptional regulator with XRE-family HTH domain
MPQSIHLVIGRNVQRLRSEHGITQDQLAARATRYGFKWSATRVGELENGRMKLSLSAFLTLANCLATLTGEPVHLGQLVRTVGQVSLDPDFLTDGAHIRRWMEGLPVVELYPERTADSQPGTPHLPMETPWFANDSATRNVARRMGLQREEVDVYSSILYGRSFGAERDARAGTEASPQQRGAVTRQMIRELQADRERRSQGV